MVSNSELSRVWKEAVVTYYRRNIREYAYRNQGYCQGIAGVCVQIRTHYLLNRAECLIFTFDACLDFSDIINGYY
jgi:hypothetical protein